MIIRFSKDITKHFTRAEYYTGWKTHDGIVRIYTRSMLFAFAMEQFRCNVNKPIIVHSWFRTKKMNERVGGIEKSNHRTGCAMDFHIQNEKVSREKFDEYIKMWEKICEHYGLVGEAGFYSWGYHFGIQTYSDKFTIWEG